MDQYTVTGMSCAACQARVEKAVSKLEGVTSCNVSLLTNTLAVEGDVPPETVVETAVREGIRLVGLSALMTTTVVSMEETIRLLKERAPEIRVVVGGAVMTQAYADAIGADHYAKEAMDTVRYADRIFADAVT